MKTLIITLFLVLTFGYSNAQNDNPYAKFGYVGNKLKTPQERLNYMLVIPKSRFIICNQKSRDRTK